jgi:hypothetical protein
MIVGKHPKKIFRVHRAPFHEMDCNADRRAGRDHPRKDDTTKGDAMTMESAVV